MLSWIGRPVMAKARQRESHGRYEASLCAGHLLVWTWRKFVVGHADCPVLAREYFAFAGEQADDLLIAFAAFLQALGSGSRRTMTVGHPHCAGLTPDEQQILRLIAAAQEGEDALLEAHLSWLVKGSQKEAVARTVKMLVMRLNACGVILPEAAYAPPPATALLEVVR
jgi:hypothetical protein